MNTITASMGGIVKALDSALASNNLVKVSETMDTLREADGIDGSQRDSHGDGHGFRDSSL